jgi:hypothetical protein
LRHASNQSRGGFSRGKGFLRILLGPRASWRRRY